jgi:hypothetical protein
VSGSKQGVIVSRNYRAVPDDCVRALAMLLEKSVIKEGGPATAPNDRERRSDEIPAKDSIP